MNFTELFGIFASLVIFISLSMTSIIKLRWINTLGCICFSIYGYFIGSTSVIFLNLGIAILNLFYLKNLYSNKDSFKLVLADCKSQYFKFFTHENYGDIEYFFAKISFLEMDKIYYLIRNNDTVGIIAWNENGSEITIKIDYVHKKYRDFQFGKYLFVENINFFKELGYTKIIQKTNIQMHKDYLEKLNFKKVSDDTYEKDI